MQRKLTITGVRANVALLVAPRYLWLCLLGWVLLIGEDAELARALVSLLSTIAFLSVRLSVKPFRHDGDAAIMMLVDLALVMIYLCALLIKACSLSPSVCLAFGFGDSSNGETGLKL
eukprot:3117677-Prymnesium_polylepis.2